MTEEELRKKIMEQIDYSKEYSDEEILQLIHTFVSEESHTTYRSLQEKEKMARSLFNSIRKLDILEELMEDEEVTEIMVNGTEAVFIEKNGRITKWDKRFESREKLEDVIQQMVSGCNRVVNESSPIVDARLKTGERVNVILHPISLRGPTVTIRRFLKQGIQLEDLVARGSITSSAAEFLKSAVNAGYNIMISGGTGSGKTTFLNALSEFIPSDERIVTIEDSAELSIGSLQNLVSLETRNANTEGCREITIRDLIKNALRMRPDRIIIGEVRGAEALDMLQALNTGHDGSLCTAHANSAKDVISRLETMCLMAMDLPLAAIRAQIASGLDIIVHLSRRRDKSRCVMEITEIAGVKNNSIVLNTLYDFEEPIIGKDCNMSGRLVVRNPLLHTEKFIRAGIDYEKRSGLP